MPKILKNADRTMQKKRNLMTKLAHKNDDEYSKTITDHFFFLLI